MVNRWRVWEDRTKREQNARASQQAQGKFVYQSELPENYAYLQTKELCMTTCKWCNSPLFQRYFDACYDCRKMFAGIKERPDVAQKMLIAIMQIDDPKQCLFCDLFQAKGLDCGCGKELKK